MRLRAILLLVMIGWSASLYWVELLGKEASYFLYPTFPLFKIPYNLFWTIFWTLGFVIMLTLLGGGTKNKTVIKNYMPKSSNDKVTELALKDKTEEIRDKLIEKNNKEIMKMIKEEVGKDDKN